MQHQSALESEKEQLVQELMSVQKKANDDRGSHEAVQIIVMSSCLLQLCEIVCVYHICLWGLI